MAIFTNGSSSDHLKSIGTRIRDGHYAGLVIRLRSNCWTKMKLKRQYYFVSNQTKFFFEPQFWFCRRWRRLSLTAGDSPYPPGSYRLKKGQKYDVFISYRGSTGRFKLWLALAGEYNIFATFMFVVVFCPLVCIGVSFVREPCQSGVPTWLLAAETCNTSIPWRSWFIFTPWGAGVTVLMLLFWQPVMFWYKRSHRMFLDKYCWTKF